VKVYLGQTRQNPLNGLAAECSRLGFGEMTTRKELPPRRFPYAFDNGAFGDYLAKRPFQGDRYLFALERLWILPTPDFLVVPDLVAGGPASISFSESWRPRVEGFAPLYLAVQDGMEGKQVEEVIQHYNGLFVGGSVPWKLATAVEWVKQAHAHGKPCHIGRVGTGIRAVWARWTGCDSIDSTVPLWAERNFRAFVNGLTQAVPFLREKEHG